MAKRKFYRKIVKRDKKRRRVFLLLKLLGAFFLLLVLCSLLLFVYYAKDLPQPEVFTEKQLIQSTKIYDRTGEVLLYEMYGEEKRTIVSLEEIPDHLKKAVIAAEDANFYNHRGIDLKGVARAVLVDLRLKEPAQGGSTISQQLIRSTFLTIEKTAERKVREIILTLELERKYSKDQILEWHLNQVPFGSNAYGVEAASQTFFNKPVRDLSLAESALLASLIQAPSYLSPYGEHKEDLLARKSYVLDQMKKLGFITAEEEKEARKTELKFAEILSPIKAPHFVLDVRKKLIEKYGEEYLSLEGLRVYTSLDWELQKIAEEVVSQGAQSNKAYNAHNAALAAIDPNNGEVLAMVGSADWFGDPYPEGCIPGKSCLFEPNFNVVTGTKQNPGRQPGSAFKPFVYAAAFKKGYDDKTIVVDEETNFGFWGDKEYIPQNYDGKFRGEITLRQSLAQSINVTSVKVLLYLAGLEESIETAEDLGITTLTPPYGPAIVLGGWEVKLIEMVSAYGVFATEGLKVPPVSILRIEDSNGNIIEENKKPPKRVLETQTCKLVTDILSDNEARAPMFGRKSALYFENYSVAAKTGTTQDYKDAWTVGYTPEIVTGVWAGNNNNSSMSKQPAVVIAGPTWHSFMERALERLTL